MTKRVRIQIIAATVAVLCVIVALIWFLNRRWPPTQIIVLTSSSPNMERATPPITDATPEVVTTTPSPFPTPASEQPLSTPQISPSPVASSASTTLLIPVAGVRPDELRDTFQDARSNGRVHDAIDIIAPGGTPVLAANDGRIAKLFLSQPGGMTIYQIDPDDRTVYYYAHLQRYADGLVEGHFAHRGEVIGYVGDTGNAGAGNYHLHFSVSIISDPKRWWEGTNINPYPLLHGTR